MPGRAIEAANNVVSEFFTHGTSHGTINEDSSTGCDKVTLARVRGTYQEFKLITNYNKSPYVYSAMHEEFCHVLLIRVLIINFEQLSNYRKYSLKFQFCLIYNSI